MNRRCFGRAFRRGRVWYIRFRIKGVEMTQKAGPTRRIAEDLLADLQVKVAREETLGIRVVARATLGEVWKVIEASRRARMSERGFQVQRDQIALAAEYFGTLAVRDFKPQNVDDFLTMLASQGRKGSTLNRYLTSLSVVLKEAVDRGFAKENVAVRVKKHRVEIRETPYLGDEEVNRILLAAASDLRPILAILADTGLRRGELLALTWSDVDLGRGVALVRRSKTGRGREVPLTTRARTAFEGLLAAHGATRPGGSAMVFEYLLAPQRSPGRKKSPTSDFTPLRRAEVRLTHQFASLVKRLGMTGISLHSLRHSCASRMVMAGVPLSAVARVTGHSTLRCAALYGRHAPQDAAKLAIQALEASASTSAPKSSSPPPGPAAGTVDEGVVPYPEETRVVG